jgi:hypothetical protein
MFGIDNVGVINQRNAPAIWESNFADFPTNTIKGRFLLALDTITLYVDLVTGNNPTNRAVVASGLIGDGSGTTINNTGTGDYSVDLGGDINQNTTININGNALNFEGNAESVIINADGYLDTQNIGIYMPVTEQTIVPLVPNVIIEFTDGINGITYQVLATK